MFTHRAAWIFPVGLPPLRDGVLTVAAGRIASVVPYQGQPVDVDHGAAAIVPGLVNAHAHLDLGALRGQLLPPTRFTDWLREVIAFRRATSPEATDAAIVAGRGECLRTGTTLIGDIAAGGRSAVHLQNGPLRSVVFYELIGLGRERAEQTWAAARQWLADSVFGESVATTVRKGLSPHAPYTVGTWLLGQAVTYARQCALPLAMHLGETRAEWELLEQHQGEFRPFLESLGVWTEDALAPRVTWLLETLGQHQPSLLAHGNYFTPRDLPAIGSSVVYCPRTHAYFGHPPHPFRAFLQAGINVALGTDSLASNPDLSLWEELRFLAQRYPDVPGETLLRMGTLHGAKALGFATECGSLEVGKAADFIVVALPKATGADPYRLLWAEGSVVQEVFVAGTQV